MPLMWLGPYFTDSCSDSNFARISAVVMEVAILAEVLS